MAARLLACDDLAVFDGGAPNVASRHDTSVDAANDVVLDERADASAALDVDVQPIDVAPPTSDGPVDVSVAHDVTSDVVARDAMAMDDDAAPACGATSCATAAGAPCDLADGMPRTVTVGPAPDTFHFACASFSPGAAAFRLNLAAAHTVTLDISVPTGGEGAVEVYSGTACDASDRLGDSCVTTSGTTTAALGTLPAGTYFVVVKSAGRLPLQLRAVLE